MLNGLVKVRFAVLCISQSNVRDISYRIYKTYFQLPAEIGCYTNAFLSRLFPFLLGNINLSHESHLIHICPKVDFLARTLASFFGLSRSFCD